MYFDWHFDPENKRCLECELVDAGDSEREPSVVAVRGSLPTNISRTDIEIELMQEAMSNV